MSQLTAVRSEPSANAASPFSAPQLAERALYRRAVQAVIWGMPAVNEDVRGAVCVDPQSGRLRRKPLFDKTWRLADIERIGSR